MTDLGTLLRQYRDLKGERANPERVGRLMCAIAHLAPWRIVCWNERCDALEIDTSDTPEEVLKKRAFSDLFGMCAVLCEGLAIAEAEAASKQIH